VTGGARKLESNTPVYSLLALVVFVVGLLSLFLTDRADPSLFVAIALANIPTLTAALFAERASRDIRNGTVTEKVRQGTTTAIVESGVLTRTGPVATSSVAALTQQTEALSQVLAELHLLAQHNARKLDTLTELGGPDVR
jgi:hypothetical protein